MTVTARWCWSWTTMPPRARSLVAALADGGHDVGAVRDGRPVVARLTRQPG